jgi:hypothetical protein
MSNGIDTEFLFRVCPDFYQVVHYINKDIDHEGNFNILPEDKMRVIKGHMQSGKTWVIICMSIYYVTKYKIPVYIVVQNSVDAREQLQQRLFEVMRVKGIHVVLRNSMDLRKTVKNIPEKYVTIIDECDFNDSGIESSAQEQLEKLKEFSSVVWNISATPMTSLVKEDVDGGNVIVLRKPENYKGITNIVFKSLPFSAQHCDFSDSDPFTKDPNLQSYIIDFSRTAPIDTHPRISLLRVGRVIAPQIKIAEYVHDRYGDEIVVITYNSRGSTYTIRGNALPDSPFSIPETGKSTVYENGVHIIPPCHIGRVLQYLHENGGAERYPRIMICAGVMADRGISFVSSNVLECKKKNLIPWHLTEMYFIASKSMNQSNILQAVGRLCGVYDDNIPLVLYSNAGEDILKAYHCSEELIERSRDAIVKKAVRLYMNQVLSEQPIHKAKIPPRTFSSGIKFKPNKISTDDRVYGGWDWKKQDRQYHGQEADFGDGDRSCEEEKKVPVARYDDSGRDPAEYEIRHIPSADSLTPARRKLFERIFECAMGELQRKELVDILVENYGYDRKPIAGRLSELADQFAVSCQDFTAPGILFFRRRGVWEWTVRVNE